MYNPLNFKIMFSFDSKAAKQKCADSNYDVIVFIVRLENGRELPVYLSTPECLLDVMENIAEYRNFLKEYLYIFGYSYGFLKSVGYAE